MNRYQYIPLVFAASLSFLAGGIGLLVAPDPPAAAPWFICGGAAGLGWVIGKAFLMLREAQP